MMILQIIYRHYDIKKIAEKSSDTGKTNKKRGLSPPLRVPRRICSRSFRYLSNSFMSLPLSDPYRNSPVTLALSSKNALSYGLFLSPCPVFLLIS